MIVSGLFRSASTHFCNRLAGELQLTFLDEVFDPLNEDILRMKRMNHEFKGVLRNLETKNFSSMEAKLGLWNDHSRFLINNHNYDIPWFEKASLFFCRRDLLGALDSMHQLIISSKQPEANIWIYADWMKRFMEYLLVAKGQRPLIIAENCGYSFRSDSGKASTIVRTAYSKKISGPLEDKFSQLVSLSQLNFDETVAYAKQFHH